MREYVVERVLDDEGQRGFEAAVAEHEHDGEDAPGPDVGAHVAQQAAVRAHSRCAPSISAAMSAARAAAPPRPSRVRTARRSAIIVSRRPGLSSTLRAAAAIVGPVAAPCRSSGTM